MKRCVLVIPDAGRLNSLWVAGRYLDILLRLDMPIVLVDAIYEEVTGDPAYPKDAEVKAFIDSKPPNIRDRTNLLYGAYERERRFSGEPGKRNAVELAMMDFALRRRRCASVPGMTDRWCNSLWVAGQRIAGNSPIFPAGLTSRLRSEATGRRHSEASYVPGTLGPGLPSMQSLTIPPRNAAKGLISPSTLAASSAVM